MYKPSLFSAIPVLMLTEKVLGFGCSTHSYTTCEDKIVHWFDPDDGMICDPLDCGGGRAPPKHGPGCAGYTGTETRGTSYLSCWKPSTTLVAAPAGPTTVVTVPAEPTSTSIVVVTKLTTYGVTESTPDDEMPTEREDPTEPETVSTGSETTSPPDDEKPTETKTVPVESETDTPPNEEKSTDTDVVSKTGPTIAAPVVPSQTQSTRAEASTPVAAPNAARALEGSLIGVAGVAIGAMVFL
ncbi:Ff.00g033390.m01.CDS01 [Fusarium sp. VM40]|nr:Ff.00g033390.m01.CDS01 [Fusarium sp. VM40]